MPLLEDLLRDTSTLLALEPEELATYLLERFRNTSPRNTHSLHNFLNGVLQSYSAPTEIEAALTEAWWWLAREGFIVESGTGSGSGWFFISSRGKRALEANDPVAFHHAQLLPRKMLHATIAAKVFAPFLRGDYETAVFAAFKEVEIAVRSASGFSADVLGSVLMRKAFDEANGPLRDTSQPTSEREALAHLFAGAIGSYKNPNSHRRVAIEAQEAVEMIVLASHLMRIVDSRPIHEP